MYASSLPQFSIIFILATISASALHIGFSPSQIAFSTESNCRDIAILTDKPTDVEIHDIWSNISSRNPKDYTKMENYLDYPTRVNVDEYRIVPVCLIPGEHSYKHGLLLINFWNTSFAGGIWITLPEAQNSISGVIEHKEAALAYDGFVSLTAPDQPIIARDLFYLIILEIIFILSSLLAIFIVLHSRRKSASY